MKRIIFIIVLSWLLIYPVINSIAQIPSYIPLVGLKAWYPFTGNLNDSSGMTGANGTLYGDVTYGSDRHGISNACYSSNGAGGVDIPSVHLPVGNHARSVSVWYKSVIPYPGGPRMLVCWGNNSALGQRFGIFAEDAGIGLEYINGSVERTFPLDSIWHNLIVTYPISGTGSSSVKIYFDGVLSTVTVFVPISSFNTDTGTIHCIGKLFPHAAYLYSWKGKIDDVGIWDRELTACEAWTIAHEGMLLDPAVISGTAIICPGGTSIFSDPVPGGTWSSSNPSVASVSSAGNVSGLTTGTAIISYTRTNVCGTVVDTHVVNVAVSAPVVVTGPYYVCPGYTISLSATSGGGVWSSSNTSVATVGVTGIVGGVSAGAAIISYTVTNSCGTTTDTQMVTVQALPVAGTISGPASVCAGATVVLSTTGVGGSWSSSNTTVATVGSTGTAGGVSAGTAIISYTVSNSCGSVSDTQQVTVLTVPLAGTISGPSVICPATTVSLSATGAGGTWSSSNPSVATVGAATGITGGVTTGTSIISYTVSNSCGSATDTQLVTVSTTPSAGVITGPDTVCAGNTITLADGVPGGIWSSSNTAIATVNTTGTAGGVSAGTAVLSYTISNACGTAFTTHSLTVRPLPVAGIITGGHTLCAGTVMTLTDATTGGTWSSSNTTAATVSTTGTVYAATAGTTIISYSASNSCGTVADTQAVTVYGLPAVAISGSSNLCAGVTATLAATPAGGTWSTGTSPVATIDGSGNLHALSPGSITITYTTTADANGCTGQATIPVTVTTTAPFTVSETITRIKCNADANGSISLTVSPAGAYSYNWSTGSTGATASGLAAGSYTVVVSDGASGCRDTASYMLQDPGVISLSDTVIHPDACGRNQGSISLVNIAGGTPPYSYSWSTGGSASSISGEASGDYSLTITDAHMCSSSFTFTIPEDSCTDINIHNVITPNGDGINDVWVIEGIGSYPGNRVQVFDKWGDMVYSQEHYDNTWSGATLPDGTYFYVVELVSGTNDKGKTLKGSLLIKR